jgi:transcriptional regulator with XRE-family HTH domain
VHRSLPFPGYSTCLLRFPSPSQSPPKALGLSQEEFAERANVHRTYISSIELGKVSVGVEVAQALARALDMKLSELVRRAE